MTTKALVKQYAALLKSDPAAANAMLEQHKDDELFLSLAKLGDALRPAIAEKKAKPQPLFEQHELFPAIEMTPPKSACGDTHDAE